MILHMRWLHIRAFKRWLLPECLGLGLIEEDLKNAVSAFPPLYRGSCGGSERVQRCIGWRPDFTNTNCICFIHMCIVQMCISCLSLPLVPIYPAHGGCLIVPHHYQHQKGKCIENQY